MKKFLRILLVIVLLVALWFLARYGAQSGLARRHFADQLAETLGLDADAVAIESTTLEFPLTFVARGVKGTLANPEVTVFETPEIRVSGCSWRLESPTVIATAQTDGSIVPAFFGPEPVRRALDGEAPSCPVAMLATISDSWEVTCEWFAIRKADIGYRDLDGNVHPVFTGLVWTKRPVRLGKHGRIDYSVAKWTSFGPATARDGRPNEGRPAEAEWLGGRGTPVQTLWAPRPPCCGDDAPPAIQEPESPAPDTPPPPTALQAPAPVPVSKPQEPASNPLAPEASATEAESDTPVLPQP